MSASMVVVRATQGGSPQQPEAPSSAVCATPLDMLLFALNSTGVPIGIVALRGLGRLGGLLLEVAIGALFVRAVAMVAAGTAPRLRQIPRLLLFAETAVDALATVAGFWAWVWRPFVGPALMKRAGARVRRRWLRRRPSTASCASRSRWAC
jgi:hypothetical protein